MKASVLKEHHYVNYKVSRQKWEDGACILDCYIMLKTKQLTRGVHQLINMNGASEAHRC
jgi:hypothetical protein